MSLDGLCSPTAFPGFDHSFGAPNFQSGDQCRLLMVKKEDSDSAPGTFNVLLV
jgi:hypothetical protein